MEDDWAQRFLQIDFYCPDCARSPNVTILIQATASYSIRHLMCIKIACALMEFPCTINDEYCITPIVTLCKFASQSCDDTIAVSNYLVLHSHSLTLLLFRVLTYQHCQSLMNKMVLSLAESSVHGLLVDQLTLHLICSAKVQQ